MVFVKYIVQKNNILLSIATICIHTVVSAILVYKSAILQQIEISERCITGSFTIERREFKYKEKDSQNNSRLTC